MWIKKTPVEIEAEDDRRRAKTIVSIIVTSGAAIAAIMVHISPILVAVILAGLISMAIRRLIHRWRLASVFVCDSCNVVQNGASPDCPCGGKHVSLTELKWVNYSVEPPGESSHDQVVFPSLVPTVGN